MGPNPPQATLQSIFRRQYQDAEGTSLRDWEEQLDRRLNAIRNNPHDSQAYQEAAYYQDKLARHAEGMEILEKGAHLCPESWALRETYINFCTICNRTEQAIAAAQDAARMFPSQFWFRLKEALLLPVIYASTQEMARYRARFTEGIQRLLREVSLETPEARQDALTAIGNHPNFHIGYQAEDDRELQSQYGVLVRRIMVSNFPEMDGSLPPMHDAGRKPIRVGYVSGRFYDVSATKCFLGWLQGHNKREFDVFTYHLGARTDRMTEEVRRASGTFRHLPGEIKETIRVIRADLPDLLVFLDVGLDARSTQVAALRLAPVQCAAWDQPITSGLSTVDYFLSSEMMEPEDAQKHYTEELVRLPGLSVCFQNPVIPKALLARSREEFGLRPNSVVYLCSQLANKLLPAQDAVFAEIAKRVPNSQFVFLMKNDLVAQSFRERVGAAFASAGLRAAEHCVLLPETTRFKYWKLNLTCDVFLDTMGWSGGVSTAEAAACGLPIVTTPGKFLRGRHSAAILERIGVTETTGADAEDYIAIASRLGSDPDWRCRIAQETLRGTLALYSDDRCVPALEGFYRESVRKTIAGRNTRVEMRRPH